MEKITVNQVIQREIEVEFPLYVKVHENLFCSFKSERVGIQVDTYDFNFGIEYSKRLPNPWMTGKQITKEEFESEFKKVQEKINQLI